MRTERSQGDGQRRGSHGAQAATAAPPSTNWAGYYSVSPRHRTVEWVQGTFTVPKLNCGARRCRPR